MGQGQYDELESWAGVQARGPALGGASRLGWVGLARRGEAGAREGMGRGFRRGVRRSAAEEVGPGSGWGRDSGVGFGARRRACTSTCLSRLGWVGLKAVSVGEGLGGGGEAGAWEGIRIGLPYGVQRLARLRLDVRVVPSPPCVRRARSGGAAELETLEGNGERLGRRRLRWLVSSFCPRLCVDSLLYYNTTTLC